MSKPRYIAHTSGKQPVGDDVLVEVVYRGGDISSAVNASKLAGGHSDWWKHEGPTEGCDIIAYRVIKE